jgi:hypothetical protein
MQTPTGRVEVENVFEIHFAVHTIFTKIWERPLLAKSTLKQVKKISKWSKNQLTIFMLDMPQVKFR